ncbi:hypothetical protein [Stenotrophomonas sepilia]|uniref:hypothetical protein n=1 Tax=Stenotrophomonas sepilia TaxID=2860290 RepID=UPI003EE52273
MLLWFHAKNPASAGFFLFPGSADRWPAFLGVAGQRPALLDRADPVDRWQQKTRPGPGFCLQPNPEG